MAIARPEWTVSGLAGMIEIKFQPPLIHHFRSHISTKPTLISEIRSEKSKMVHTGSDNISASRHARSKISMASQPFSCSGVSKQPLLATTNATGCRVDCRNIELQASNFINLHLSLVNPLTHLNTVKKFN